MYYSTQYSSYRQVPGQVPGGPMFPMQHSAPGGQGMTGAYVPMTQSVQYPAPGGQGMTGAYVPMTQSVQYPAPGCPMQQRQMQPHPAWTPHVQAPLEPSLPPMPDITARVKDSDICALKEKLGPFMTLTEEEKQEDRRMFSPGAYIYAGAPRSLAPHLTPVPDPDLVYTSQLVRMAQGNQRPRSPDRISRTLLEIKKHIGRVFHKPGVHLVGREYLNTLRIHLLSYEQENSWRTCASELIQVLTRIMTDAGWWNVLENRFIPGHGDFIVFNIPPPQV